jgi:hypothetical protein
MNRRRTMSKDKAKECKFKDANTLSLKKEWIPTIDPVQDTTKAVLKARVEIKEGVYTLLKDSLIMAIFKMGTRDCVVSAPYQLKGLFMMLVERDEVPPEVTDIVLGWETCDNIYYLDTKPLPKGEIPGYERIYTRPQKEDDNASDV